MSSLDYIFTNFLTMGALVKETDLDKGLLVQMMDEGCLPGPAYTVGMKAEINSIFGVHDECHKDDYYPQSHIQKAKAIAKEGLPLTKQAETLKKAFFATYQRLLQDACAQDFDLGHLFKEGGEVGGLAAERFLDEEWTHYLKGTYGLCTRSASFEDIATKEIMIAKIKHLVSFIENEPTPDLLNELKEATYQLDQVSAPFAPHEVARSSRGCWINEVRKKYL